jgi:hypothetical protein
MYMDFLMVGLGTSLLNHGYTNTLFQLIDRGMMILGLYLDTRILLMNNIYDRTTILYLQGLTIGCYLSAKLNNNTKTYLYSHILSAITHLCMISSIYFGCRSNINERISPQFRELLCT